jgi:hypothetical protein
MMPERPQAFAKKRTFIGGAFLAFFLVVMPFAPAIPPGWVDCFRVKVWSAGGAATAVPSGELNSVVSNFRSCLPLWTGNPGSSGRKVLNLGQAADGGRAVGYNEGSRTRSDDGTRKYAINVKERGALGDGVTDDSAAIQRAIDEIKASDRGGNVLYFPPGKYLCNSALAADGLSGSIIFQGAGAGSSEITFVAGVHPGISLIGPEGATPARPPMVQFRDILISGSSTTAHNADLVRIVGFGRAVFEHTRMIRFGGTIAGKPATALVLKGVLISTFVNVFMSGGNRGIALANSAAGAENRSIQNTFINPGIDSCTEGIALGLESDETTGGSGSGMATKVYSGNIEGCTDGIVHYGGEVLSIFGTYFEQNSSIIKVPPGRTADQIYVSNISSVGTGDAGNIKLDGTTRHLSVRDSYFGAVTPAVKAAGTVTKVVLDNVTVSPGGTLLTGSVPEKVIINSGPAAAHKQLEVNGVDMVPETGPWMPALTFSVPGDLSVAYSTREGRYIKRGKLVTVMGRITTSAFTHSTMSGRAMITGLPFSSANVGAHHALGSVHGSGITKANYTHVSLQVPGNSSVAYLLISGSGQRGGNVEAAEGGKGDMPSGANVDLMFSVTYEIP